ncbi:MAG: phage tail tape measure protein [Myxococcota bacterium]
MAYSVEYVYQLVDRFSPQLRQINETVDRSKRVVAQASQRMGGMGNRMHDAARKAGGLHSAIGGVGLGAAMTGMVRRSAEVEAAMAGLAKVTDLEGAALKAMEGQLEKISEQLSMDKIGVIQQAVAGVKTGIPVDELSEFVMLSAKMGTAFDISAEQAGQSLSKIQAMMGLPQAGMEGLTDSVNFLADNVAADGSRMIEIIQRASGTFAALKMPTGVSAGFAAFADQMSVSPELAASGIKMMFRGLQEIPGMTDKLLADPIGAVMQTLGELEGLSPEARFNAIIDMFGKEVAPFVTQAVEQRDKLEEAMRLAMSPEASGSMQRELDKVLQTSSAKFKQFGGTFMNTMQTIGDVLTPTLVRLAELGTAGLNAFQSFAQANPVLAQLALGLVGATAAIATVGGAMSLAAPMISGVTGAISGTVSAFKSMALLFATNPILAAVAAIAAAAYLIYTNWDEISAFFSRLWTGVKEAFFGFQNFVMGFDLSEAALTFVNTLVAPIRDTITAIIAFIREQLGGIMDFASGIIDGIANSSLGQFVGNIFADDNTTERAAENKAAMRSETNVNVSGDIGVRADPGTQVTENTVDLNTGANVPKRRRR